MNARSWFAAAACMLSLACGATSSEGIVSHVTDGDSIWVRPIAGGPPQQVRIQGIDAPEICQPFGPEARDALARRVMHRRVTLSTSGQDDYRRTVARVKLGRSDIGAWLVRRGHAWSYRFRKDPGPYLREERAARKAHRGLWASGRAELPRDFRVRHGACH